MTRKSCVHLQALIRDGYKCVVTRTYDECAFSFVDSELVLAADVPIHTELAHIVPQSTYFNVSSTPGSSSDKVILLSALHH